MKEKWQQLRQRYRSASRPARRGMATGAVLLALWLLFLLANALFPLPAPKPYSQTIFSADSTLLAAYLSPDDKWRLRSSLDQVSDEMQKAIIAKEDRWFYFHPGINPFSILRAVFRNITSVRRTSGASTLTMQLARMAEPGGRTYGKKIREMFRALQYEWRYTKDEILEMYLSYLPYGGNIEGVHAASYLFFDRPPARLSLSQAILLAIVPNRPNSLRLDLNAEVALAARNQWINRFAEKSIFPADQLDAAREEGIPGRRYSFEVRAPHFCYRVRGQMRPGQDRTYTSLQLPLQQQVERLLKNHTTRLRSTGLSNGAVILIDNRDSRVVAYCGSADFYDAASQGQVDGIRAVRSPGSTLKPAIYAMAFDRGFIAPKNKLLDLPTHFQGFRPENYDLEFHGQVTVEYALSHSLNIPPVRLLQELGMEPFLNLMERAGFETLRRKRDDLGLSVILGGCGVTLEELTRFYSSFARGGQMHPLAYTQDESPAGAGAVELFSEPAAYLIAEILSGLERPDLPQRFIGESKLPRVAWKTGTSYGRRDAWSIGFSPRYTVGVWMGNFDGRGIPDLSGTQTAVPLLLDIFNAIDYDRDEKWFSLPHEVGQRKVCAETGMLPGDFCTHLTQDHFIRDVSSLQVCNLYESLYVSTDQSMQYCPVCLPTSGYSRESYPLYPSELALWYETRTVPYKRPPPHNPDCEGKFSGEGPVILSPASDLEYYVEKGSEQQILLQAASETTVTKQYWYVNDRFVGETPANGKVFIHPAPGRLKIICMDDKGRKSQTEVVVKVY